VAEEASVYEVSVEGDSLDLVADARLLRRLIRNLLENARRHARGTEVSVCVERAGDLAWLRVQDGGPGVPESDRERIFEPFFRSGGHGESQHGGVGLGLSLVRRIARRYGGDAVVRQGDRGGSIFEVSFRLSA
jgi:signal transduction histidine kinase